MKNILNRYNWMISIISKNWYLYLIIILLLIIDGVTTWFFPYNIRQILNFNIPQKNVVLLHENLVLLGIITVISLLNTLLLNYLFSSIGSKSTYAFEIALIKKTFSFDGADIKRNNDMILGILYRDIYLLQNLFSRKIFSFVCDIMFLVIILFFLASIDITFVVPIIVIYPILIIITCLMKNIIKNQTKKLSDLRDTSSSFIKEYVSNLYELIAYKGENYFLRRYTKVRREIVNKEITNNLTTDYLNLIIGVLNCIALIIYLILGSNKVINNTMSLGDLSIFILYVNRLFGPIGRIINFISSFAQVKVSLGRVNLILEERI